jgi:Arc/MetJ-type ribon-helix-helix transcriptional regulator
VARTGLSKSQVKQARDQLVAEGRYPSADAVRAALGNTGSKSTIHRYLKELESEGSEARASREETERSLHAMIEQIAEKLHSDAEFRTRAITASYEEMLRKKDAEIAALREAVAMLSICLNAPSPTAKELGGFGHFDSLAFGTRCGARDTSAFSIMLDNDRSTMPDLAKISPSGLKFQ